MKTHNRYILVAPCDDPRKQGVIHVEGQSPGLGWGKVLAVDEAAPVPGERPRVGLNVGDVVFFRDQASQPVVCDDNQVRAFVNEYDVLGSVPGAQVKVKDATAMSPKARLMIPRGDVHEPTSIH